MRSSFERRPLNAGGEEGRLTLIVSDGCGFPLRSKLVEGYALSREERRELFRAV